MFAFFIRKLGVNKSKYLTYLYLVCIVSTFSAYAKEDYVDEVDLMDDVQTVTSATRLKQKITDAPVSVTIIDSEMIEASGATEVHELMRLVPGFFSYSILGGQFAVTNHFQPRDVDIRLEVQINGRSVYEPFFTTVDWSALGIDVRDVDYIEVIRGSSATAYGSNAFLGAINIITKDALSRPKASIRTRLGNIGRKEVTVNQSGNTKNIDYAFSLVHKSNTGFTSLKPVKQLRDLNNDDRESLNISLRGNYVPNLENELLFEVGLGRTDVEIPDSLDVRGFSNRRHNNSFQKLTWKNKTDLVEHLFQIYHSRLNLDDDLNAGLLSSFFNVTPEQIPILFPGQHDEILTPSLKDSLSERYDIEFSRKGRALNTDYVWGLGARTNRVKSPTLFGSGVRSEDRFRLFGNLDWHINSKLNTNFGVLAERTELSNWAFSPRVALNFHPLKNQTIRTSITNGKRVPSVTFQNLNVGLRFADGTLVDVETIGADNLKTETVTAYEIAYIANIPRIDTQFEIKLFREDMKDLLRLLLDEPFDDLDGSVRIWDNIINTTTQGIELQVTHQFKSIGSGLNARLGYAYFDTEGLVQDDSKLPPRKASSIPRHSATLLLSKRLRNQFDISSVLQYQSDYSDGEIGDVGIKRVDFRLGKKVNFGNSKGKIGLVIQNAFNKYNDFSASFISQFTLYFQRNAFI